MATSVQDFLKQNPQYVGWANTSNRTASTQQPTQAKQKPRGRGGFLSSLISEGGAASGAAGGAAIGTAILPGIGTILGAGLGGLIGGTAGRGVENKVRDDQNFLGAGGSAKAAFTEGALSGALSAAGAGVQVAKAGKAASSLASALDEGDDAAKAASKAIKNAKPQGVLERKGVNITSKAGGYYSRDNVPGIGVIDTAKQKYYDDLLRKLKIPANDAGDIAERVGRLRKATAEGIDAALSKSNTKLTPKQLKEFSDEVMASLDKGGITNESRKYVRSQLETMRRTVKDTRGLHQFRKDVDEAINWNANPDSATAQMQQGAKTLREAIRNKLNNSVAGLKQSNNLYHDLTDIEKLSLKASGRVAGESTSANGGLFSRVLTSPTANTVRAKVGRGMASVGEKIGPGAPGAWQAARYAKIQSPVNIGEAIMGGVSAPPTDQPQDNVDVQDIGGVGYLTPDALYGTQAGDQPSDQSMQQTPQPTSTFSRDDLIASVQNDFATTGGKNVEKYISLYKILNEESGNELTAVQKNKVAGYQTANEVLGQLEQLWQNVNQPNSQAAAGVAGLPGIKQVRSTVDPNVRQYTQFAEGTLAPVIKSLGETGVLTDRDIIRAYGLVPNLQDSPTVAAQKIVQLRQLLTGAQQATVYGGGGSTTDELSNLIMQGAYQ